ncbi:PAS domain S-box protein [Aquabacterium sp. OR-4]|uniref:PAS domain S-box protein n=1 Tax=Aquabacterium sp. OR-4 TaxID=2978127 RepID=UPI0028C6308E|nr:PAS domain S-box protein [Aquabacterium sp. OR-4]MDT7836246.1 PAS domain S-box protein [Aquabacterium sp. OR-4]
MNPDPVEQQALATAVQASERDAELAARLAAISQGQCVAEFAPDGSLLAANERFVQMMGWPLDEVLGRHQRSFCLPGIDADPQHQALWQALREGRAQQGEFLRVARDGHQIWLQATYTPIVDRRGQLRKVVEFATDISHGKRASLAADAQLMAIWSSQGVIAFDLQGHVLDANPVFLDTVGYGLFEVLGQDHRLFCTPEHGASAEYQAFWAALREGQPQRGEFMRLDRHGRPMWLQATYTPIPGLDGRPERIVKFATDITADKLRAMEDQGKMAAVLRTQAVIEFDLDGHILDANALFLDAMGYRRDEVLGRHHRLFCLPGFADTEGYRAFWTRLHAGQPQAGEFMRLGAQGKLVWLQATYTPILGADGRPYKIVKFATDISAAVAARQASAQAATGLALRDAALASSGDGMLIVAVEPTGAHAVYANAAAAGLAGCDVQTLLAPDGQRLRERLLDGEGQTAVLRALAEHQVQRTTLRRQAPDGSERWLALTVSPMAGDPAQRIGGTAARSRQAVQLAVLTVDDITDRVAADLRLRDEVARMQTIFALSPDGFVSFDAAGRVISVNPAFEQLTGLDASRLLHADGASFDAALEAVVAERNPRGTAQWLAGIRGIGDPDVRADVLRLAGAGARVVVCSRRRCEAATISQVLHLRDISAEMLADRTQREFMANMSHEIRTPMNGVIGLIGVLQQSGLDAEQQETAELIRNSGVALLGILDDILDFSKIEAGQMSLETLAVNGAQIIEQACGVLDPLALDKAVDLTWFTDPQLPELMLADPLRLRQVVTNLVGNAIKFSARPERRGQVHVRWTAEPGAAGQPGVRLSVRDDGIGIDAQAQQRLFQPFVQADLSTTRRFGGTGLGLTITRAMVDAMGGQITLHSQPGQGSTFAVWLPLRLPDDAGPLAATGYAATGCATPAQPVQPALHGGLQCHLVAAPDSSLRDLAAYLHAAGAHVQLHDHLPAPGPCLDSALYKPPQGTSVASPAANPAANPAASPADSPTLWIIDQPTQNGPAQDAALAALAAWLASQAAPPALLLVGRGRGRRARARAAGAPGLHIDANALGRAAWLQAVAQALGPMAAAPAQGREPDRAPAPPPAAETDAGAAATPARPAPAAQPSRPGSTPATPASRAAAPTRSERILVAEDNPANQKVIAFQLRKLGFAADIVADGQQALERLAQARYDLVLTDLHMPVMDGYQFTSAWRTAETAQPANAPRLPVVALTANAQSGEAEHCRRAGIDDYLTKPTSLERLAAMLQRWLPTPVA